MTNPDRSYAHIRLSILILFLSFALMSAHAAVPSLEQPDYEYQSSRPFIALAHLELGQDFWSRLMDTSGSTGAALDGLYSDSKLNSFLSKAEVGRYLSESDCGRLRELLKAGFLHISRDIVPGQFWEEQLARFYSNVLTMDEAESHVVSHQNASDSRDDPKLEQLRIAFVRDVLPDLVPQIKSMAQSFRVSSGGMSPSLLVGDHFIVNKLAYQDHAPDRGDIIVFKFPEDESKTFVKRIIGLPKDTLEIRDKIVYLNNEVLREDDYVLHLDAKIIEKTLNPRDNIGPLVVPDDGYFVLGDNREGSLDSRFWGFLKRDKIIGKVSLIYWSWDDAAKTTRWDRSGQRIK